MTSATERLRAMLDERGVEWDYGITGATTTRFNVNGVNLTFTPMRDGLVCSTIFTPEQAVAATLGREPWVNPTWERWHKSLKHDEIKSIGDAVEQLMYEAIDSDERDRDEARIFADYAKRLKLAGEDE